jgi:signal transduction histidine kinase/ActR/RegA family two-component response regulator
MAGVVVSTVAVIGTATSRGPFSRPDAQQSLFLLWAYAACLALGATILAAAVAERDEAERARARAEEERRVAEERSQRADRLESLGVLASGVAHDFNNLLVAIRGNAELLRLQMPSASQLLLESLDEIDAATKRSADLCRQMMVYAGRSQPIAAPLDPARVIEESIRIVRGSISSKVTLAFEGPDPPCVVIADATQLGTAVVNLLVNAADAIGDSEGRIEIALSRREMDRDGLDRAHITAHAEPGRYVALEVTDDGVGMDAATIEHVFEPFFTTKVLGHGLGLSSVAGIARAHRGALVVQSAPGAGTRIAVLLPSAPDDAVVVLPAAPPEIEGARFAGSVLVADDLPAVLTVASRALGLAGWQVLLAEDGRAALALFEECDVIDVVVLDIDMPRLDGIETLRAMRALRPDLPAVLMSGKPPDPSGLPACVFMAKPFTLAELRAALERARESSSSGQRVPLSP